MITLEKKKTNIIYCIYFRNQLTWYPLVETAAEVLYKQMSKHSLQLLGSV